MRFLGDVPSRCIWRKSAIICATLLVVMASAMAQEASANELIFSPDEDEADNEQNSSEEDQPRLPDDNVPPLDEDSLLLEMTKEEAAEAYKSIPTHRSESIAQPVPPVVDPAESRARSSDKTFGRYRVNVGMHRPEFSEAQHYERLYGRYGYAPTLSAEYYPYDFFVTLGVSMKTSLYNDTGKAAVNSDATELDQDSKVGLTIMPAQLALIAQIPLLPSKWLVFSGWFGQEWTLFQELRRTNAGDGDEDNKTYVNRSTKQAAVAGGALHIRISPMGGGKHAGFVSAIQYNAIYLSPYFETVRSLDNDGLKLSGQRLGLAFSFEIR